MTQRYTSQNIPLLKKSRKINKSVQKAYGFDFKSISTLLSELIEADVYFSDCDKKAMQTNHSLFEGMINSLPNSDNQSIPINDITDTLANIPIEEKLYTIIPIYGGNIRFGYLIAVKASRFTDDDLILTECAATFLGMGFLNAHKKAAAQTSRQRQNIKMALSKLSLSEAKAFITILDKFKGLESILNTTKIANNAGITRSVVTTALRKLETGQLIKVKPLGPKGTYIYILDPMVLEEMSDIKNRLLSSQ